MRKTAPNGLPYPLSFTYPSPILHPDDAILHPILHPKSIAYKGIFPENITPKRHLKEFRDYEKEVAVGDNIGLELFNDSRFLDVTATSKGKGFQGVMKRWGFHGGRATHGSKFHREPGGTGNCTTPGHCFKNVKLPGHMGFKRVTVQNLKIVKIDPELNVILVRGAVPGNKDCTLIVKSAVKK